MISLLIVSHSNILAKGVKELASQMAPEVIIGAVGGTKDGELGNDYEKIYNELDKIYSEDGVIVLFDLGSSYMSVELVKEELMAQGKENIYIIDAAIVEGAVVAAVQISLDSDIETIKAHLLSLKLNKI